MPRGRSRPVRFPLPRIAGAEDVPAAVAAILEGVSAGELAPSEGMDLIRVVESAVRLLGAAARLEAQLAERELNTRQEQAAAGEAAEAAQNSSAEQAPAAAAENTRPKQPGQPARLDATAPRVVQMPITAADNTSRKQAGLGAGWVPISEVWGEAAAVG
jgi:sRNA-binding protein